MSEVEDTEIFDLEVLQEKLKEEEHQYDEFEDRYFVSHYIGSVMSLLPSGKYYTPFACSNVEVCETCREEMVLPCTKEDPCKRQENDVSDESEDWHCEACQDARWLRQAEKELSRIDAYLVSGEGDPTDLFVEQEV